MGMARYIYLDSTTFYNMCLDLMHEFRRSPCAAVKFSAIKLTSRPLGEDNVPMYIFLFAFIFIYVQMDRDLTSEFRFDFLP